MVSLNKVFVAGNLTRDPEIRYTSSGKAVADLGLAINNVFITQSGEKRENTVFVQVETWGKQAENAKNYLSKGSPILIEGSLKYDTWESQEGEKKSRLKISASRIQFLNSKGRSDRSGSESDYNDAQEPMGSGAGKVKEPAGPSSSIEDDDIPF